MGAPLIKWKAYGYKNPLSRARALGSAHHGVSHWIAQRVTSVALIPLQLWLLISIIRIMRMDHAAFVAWLSLPWNTVLMLMTVFTMFYHAILGSQVVIEDYEGGEAAKIIKIYGMKLILIATGVACIYAILKVAL